jgi:hypothetical protein
MSKTVTATAADYVITLNLETNRVTICRESGEWAGDGWWRDGRIVDCSAHLADDPDESERLYEALEDALGDEIDEAERLAGDRNEDDDDEARYIVVQAAECDGGLQVARIATDETEDQCARRCGAVIRSYGPYERGEYRNYTRAEAFAELARIEAEEAEYEEQRRALLDDEDD